MASERENTFEAVKREIPNSATLQAFDEVEELKKNPMAKSYSCFRDLLEEVKA